MVDLYALLLELIARDAEAWAAPVISHHAPGCDVLDTGHPWVIGAKDRILRRAAEIDGLNGALLGELARPRGGALLLVWALAVGAVSSAFATIRRGS